MRKGRCSPNRGARTDFAEHDERDARTPRNSMREGDRCSFARGRKPSIDMRGCTLPHMVRRSVRDTQRVVRDLLRSARWTWHRWNGAEVVHLLHIGKTGGTALGQLLRSQVSTRHLVVPHGHRTRLEDVPRGDKVVFFVRDPVDRFVSGFWSRYREGKPRYHVPWTTGEHSAFGVFETPDQLGRALGADDEQIRNHAEVAMRTIEHVRDSYWYWFRDPHYFRSRVPDFLLVGFTETFDEDVTKLRQILELSPSAALPTDDTAAHRRPPTQDPTLSPHAVANLQRWYARDYEFIELCREIRGA